MNLLFVCSGNTCRSALAEALARKIAERRGIEDINVSSAGTNAWDNAPATDEAKKLGKAGVNNPVFQNAPIPVENDLEKILAVIRGL